MTGLNALRVMWLVDRSTCSRDLAGDFLDVTGQLLPEALPVRVGFDDPPADAFSPSQFANIWESDQGGWIGARPFGFGSVSNVANLGSPSERLIAGTLEPSVVGQVSTSFDSGFLEIGSNEDRVRTYLTTVAERFNAFFACVCVERGAQWRRSSLTVNDGNPAVVTGSVYYGLPIGDLWLAYFGTPYSDFVKNSSWVRPHGQGWTGEIAGAWSQAARTGTHNLIGRVPEQLLQYTVDRKQVRGRAEIRSGIRLAPADVIPSELIPSRVGYRALAWAPSSVDRERVTTTLSRLRFTVDEPSENYIVATRDGWTLRLRSSDFTQSSPGAYILRRMYDGSAEVQPGYELSESINDYTEVWEVTGAIDRDMVHFNDWLSAVEAVSIQDPKSVWADVGSLH